MAQKKQIRYGLGSNDYIVVDSLTDELKFVDLMKVYKAFGSLDEALTTEAKERIRLID